MIQDICNECWESGYKAGRENAVLEITEVLRVELHKYIMNRDIVYINDVISLLDKVKSNALCQEANPN